MLEASVRYGAVTLMLVLTGAGHAVHAAEEPLSDDAIRYEAFLEAASEAVRAEEARACTEEGFTGKPCRETSQAVIEERARRAYVEHMEEKAFRRRQAEDAEERHRRDRLIQVLFEDEYQRALTSVRHDINVVHLPVGSKLCAHERSGSGPGWATVDGITEHNTVRLKLHVRTRHGDEENGTGEAVIRRHPLYPDVYELETLTVTDVMGVTDHTHLGLKKSVELCEVP
jgi:hypothetical protein